MRQITSNILMVRPANFGFNVETAASNAFQSEDNQLTEPEIKARALAEFDEFVEKLRAAGVQVIVADDTAEPTKPDAVFPNNWVTFHEDGRVVTYPMLSEMRRLERREDIIRQLSGRFVVAERVHLEQFEKSDAILEGTGSLILDRENKIAYACLSPRTDEKLLNWFCLKMDFEKVAFHAVDGKGQEIYHTNVLMALGLTFVVICLDTVRDAGEKQHLLTSFEKTGKEVIEISLDQMMAFAGNMLQVATQSGAPVLVMSEQAYRSLRPDQIARLEHHNALLHSPLYTIEQFGGGSARCMMAEVFLRES